MEMCKISQEALERDGHLSIDRGGKPIGSRAYLEPGDYLILSQSENELIVGVEFCPEGQELWDAWQSGAILCYDQDPKARFGRDTYEPLELAWAMLYRGGLGIAPPQANPI
jgi:hypothetical protein